MDTIAAIATAQLPSAIGIVRISGEQARRILAALFVPVNGVPVEQLPPRRMSYGTVRSAEGNALDQILAVWFTADHSYTGEESVELHGHGSPVVLNEILQAVFAAGARQARPGEFTKRAFLHGKMDLTEAEAVIDLIDAETAEAARNALSQLDGALRRPIEQVYDQLLNISSQFYAIVDYPDEEIEELTERDIVQTLSRVEKQLTSFFRTYERGKILKSGVATAIIGAPNAGKSSLLNALVGYERTIVTEIAGTTRDTVEEKAVLGGVLLRLIDTAGIHETGDAVEKLGVERSRKAVETADLIFVLVDGSQSALTEEDQEALQLAAKSGKPWIFVQTKKDLFCEKMSLTAVEEGAQASVALSSVTGEGIEVLESAIVRLYPKIPAGNTMLSNARQAEAVKRALTSVCAAKDALEEGMTADVVLTEVEEAQNALGELTGRTARADMVERIFERFCVGK